MAASAACTGADGTELILGGGADFLACGLAGTEDGFSAAAAGFAPDI